MLNFDSNNILWSKLLANSFLAVWKLFNCDWLLIECSSRLFLKIIGASKDEFSSNLLKL